MDDEVIFAGSRDQAMSRVAVLAAYGSINRRKMARDRSGRAPGGGRRMQLGLSSHATPPGCRTRVSRALGSPDRTRQGAVIC